MTSTPIQPDPTQVDGKRTQPNWTEHYEAGVPASLEIPETPLHQ